MKMIELKQAAVIKSPNEDFRITAALRDFIKQCPYLPDFYNSLNVNYLDGDPDSFMIEQVPVEPIVKRYVNGDTARRYSFYFSSRESYTQDVLDNLDSASFYENFEGWLEECTKQRVFPELGDNRQCMSISATTHGYVFTTQNGLAQYLIQCEMQFYQRH